MQRSLEDIAFKLRIPQRKPWQQMVDDIIRVTKIVNDDAKVGSFSISHGSLEPTVLELFFFLLADIYRKKEWDRVRFCMLNAKVLVHSGLPG